MTKEDIIISLLREIEKNMDNLGGSETDNLLSEMISNLEKNKADKSTTYTKLEVDNLISTNTPDVDLSNYYTLELINAYIESLLNSISENTQLFSNKADKSTTYTKTEVDAQHTTLLNKITALENAELPSLYDLYKEYNGTISEKAFPVFFKYLVTPFMISNSSTTTIPDELLNEEGTNFITEYYWLIMKLTGGEPVITTQWSDNIPSTIKGMMSGKEFTVDFTGKTITPVQ